MFTFTLFNASTLYYVVTAWMHPEEYTIITQQLTLVFLFGMSYAGFLGMTISASVVYEKSVDVSNEAKKLLNNRRRHTGSQRQFLAIVKGNLSLSV